MDKLCVPYFNARLNSEYLLYSIIFERQFDTTDWFCPPNSDSTVYKKLSNLQDYFEKWHYAGSYPAKVEFEKFVDDNKAKYIDELNNKTLSVFLGIFLKAAEQIQNLEFKDDWQTICVTGNLEYDKINNKLELISVDDEEKEIEKKFNGEFIRLAEDNDTEKHLFLFISNEENILEEEKQKLPKNITIQRFSSNTPIEEIIDFVFKPYSNNLNYSDFDRWRRKRRTDMDDQTYGEFYSLQKSLSEKMESKFDYDYGYRPGDNFPEFIQAILTNGWRGFFIYGDGFSGKSATARTIARYLMYREMIYAPVWIDLENKNISDLLRKKDIKPDKGKKRKPHDEVELYLKSEIDSQFEKEFEGNPKSKMSKQQYLVVIDNVELNEEGINRIFMALDTIYNDSNYKPKIIEDSVRKPYLIVTSKLQCKDKQLIKKLTPDELRAPIMSVGQITDFIEIVARKQDLGKEIEIAKKSSALTKLANILLDKFNANPGIIITVAGLLHDMNIDDLCTELEKRGGGQEQDIRKKMAAIYQLPFSVLDKKQDKKQLQILYLFLRIIEEDILLSEDEIYEKIVKLKHWKENNLTLDDLKSALRDLHRYNIIYSPENKTKYGIKSIAYDVFMFEKDFLGEDRESGKCLRDKFIQLCQQLEKALCKDQNIKIIEPIIEKMKGKCNSCSKFQSNKNYYFSLAACYSSNPEILSLLMGFGCDINKPDSSNITPFEWAARRNSKTTILEWFKSNNAAIELDTSVSKGNTIAHYACICNSEPKILKWLFDNGFKINEKNIDGEIPFQNAVRYNPSTAILDFLFEKGVCIDTELSRVTKDEYNNNLENVKNIIKNNENLVNINNNFLEELKDVDESIFNKIFDIAPCNRIIVLAIHNPNIEVFRWMLKHGANTKGLWLLIANLVKNIKYFDLLFDYDQGIKEIWFERNICFFALAYANTTALEWIINKDPNLIYDTIFHDAIDYENVSSLIWLFDNIPEPQRAELLNNKDEDGRTVFHYAAQNRNTDILEKLLEYIPQPQRLKLIKCKDKEGLTVFHLAKQNPVFEWLFNNIPKPQRLLRCRDKDGWTVFHCAIQNSNTDVLDWLLNNIKQPQKLLKCKDKNGLTVFHYAVRENNTDALKWLFNNVLQSQKLLKCRDKNGLTVFHYAARNCNADTLCWLFKNVLQSQKLIRYKGGYGRTVFHYAVQNSNTDVFEWLLKNIKQPQKLLKCRNKEGWTAFHDIVLVGKIIYLEYIFQYEHDIDINKKIYSKYTALNLAIQENNISIVKRLLYKSAEINRYELLIASLDKDDDEYKYKLLCLKAKKINRWDKIDIFPLMEAVVFNEDERILKFLLSMGYPTEARNKLGQTPLMAAALNPNPKMAITLLEYGADLEIKDCSGKTALSYIQEHEQHALILEKAAACGGKYKQSGNSLMLIKIFNSLNSKSKRILLELIKLRGNINTELEKSEKDRGKRLFMKKIKTNRKAFNELIRNGIITEKYFNGGK